MFKMDVNHVELLPLKFFHIFVTHRSNLLRPLRAKDPESIWNLLDIVRNLFQVEDPNATKVLQILTEECLNFHQLALWWFTSETQNDEDPYSRSRDNNRSSTNLPATEVAKHTGAKLLEEHVSLWKVVVMNPKINDREKAEWKFKLEGWQKAVVEKARKGMQLIPVTLIAQLTQR